MDATTISITARAIEVSPASGGTVVCGTASNFVIDQANRVGSAVSGKSTTALAKHRLTWVWCACPVQRAGFTIIAIGWVWVWADRTGGAVAIGALSADTNRSKLAVAGVLAARLTGLGGTVTIEVEITVNGRAATRCRDASTATRVVCVTDLVFRAIFIA